MHFKNWILLVVVVSVMIVSSGCNLKSRKGPAPQIRRAVEVFRVREREFVDKIYASGVLKGVSQLAVLPKAPGKFLRYVVSEGAIVRKGDVIAEIDRDVTGFKYEPLKVISPIEAQVLELPLDVGQTVGIKTVVAFIGKIDELELNVFVSEKDVALVKKGQKVVVKVDAMGEQEFEGRVAAVSYRVDPITHNVRVKIRLPNRDYRLLPGMFARAQIITGFHKAVAVVRDGVMRVPATNVNYCYVVEDGKVVKRILKLGMMEANFQEVLSGLKIGDKVIISGQGGLKEGLLVEIKEEE